MVVLYAARHQLPVPALARWLLALGIVATLAANVAHGWPDGPVGAAVAAWPAASLVGSYELLLWLIRTASTGATAREPGTDHVDEPADQMVSGLRLVPNIGNSRAGSPQADSVSPQESDHRAGPIVDPDRVSGPDRPSPEHLYWQQGQQMARWPMAGATTQAAGTEAGINAAAVIAYRASLDNRQPLSERSLAATFGKTSRRWARHRMAEARQASATAVVEVESAGQPPATTHL
jgi:hypothetical protein